ncbi:discoidin domain-containing protein [Ideonella sp. 4Y16]|uniref:Discoidin domain-containing protein n=1 Tax=Ideonella alba TaxID=2824118 RepID=A0A940Y350_9BURK|nr:discoidin domain-containing protein [Ideonella alba]MBQ0929454.1 discoidin domain-containing protein [Ideonella alba]MBQ0944556.1 discoidin domain-containing protein [Ideonella alba]
MFTSLLGVGLGLCLAFPAAAATVSCSAPVTGCSFAYDGDWPAQGQDWTTNTAWWRDAAAKVKIDLGEVVDMTGLTISVDNNDDYKVMASVDGQTWTRVLNIRAADSEINFGMDTISTVKGDPDRVKGLGFQPGPVRYFRISASNGDGLYSVGELLVHTAP